MGQTYDEVPKNLAFHLRYLGIEHAIANGEMLANLMTRNGEEKPRKELSFYPFGGISEQFGIAGKPFSADEVEEWVRVNLGFKKGEQYFFGWNMHEPATTRVTAPAGTFADFCDNSRGFGKASMETMKSVEENVPTVGMGAGAEHVAPGKLLYFAFDEIMGREGQYIRGKRFLICNKAIGPDGKIRAFRPHFMIQWKDTIDSQLMFHLANEKQRVLKEDVRPTEAGLRTEGVDDEWVKKMSPGSERIKEAAKLIGHDTPQGRALIALATRPEKVYPTSFYDLYKHAHSKTAEIGRSLKKLSFKDWVTFSEAEQLRICDDAMNTVMDFHLGKYGRVRESEVLEDLYLLITSRGVSAEIAHKYYNGYWRPEVASQKYNVNQPTNGSELIFTAPRSEEAEKEAILLAGQLSKSKLKPMDFGELLTLTEGMGEEKRHFYGRVLSGNRVKSFPMTFEFFKDMRALRDKGHNVLFCTRTRERQQELRNENGEKTYMTSGLAKALSPKPLREVMWTMFKTHGCFARRVWEGVKCRQPSLKLSRDTMLVIEDGIESAVALRTILQAAEKAKCTVMFAGQEGQQFVKRAKAEMEAQKRQEQSARPTRYAGPTLM